MNRRLELHEKLCEILGSRNVYFQPPESVRMVYPAIVYSIDGVDTIHADNGVYKTIDRYSVILIDRDPDTRIFNKLRALPLCRFERPYKADNLNHYMFSLFY